MPSVILILLFIGLPIAEIATFIMVGSRIGVLPTIGLLFLSAVMGAVLLRLQGFGAMMRIRQELDAGRAPARSMAHGAMIMLAGMLLILPGFLTDILGLLLFIPPFRDLLWRLIGSNITIVTSFPGGFGGRRDRGGGKTIDLDADDYSKTGDHSTRPDQNSPWRRIDRS